jgi:hypothetical protein
LLVRLAYLRSRDRGVVTAALSDDMHRHALIEQYCFMRARGIVQP